MDMIQNISAFRISLIKLIKIELLEKINIFKIHRGFHAYNHGMDEGRQRERK